MQNKPPPKWAHDQNITFGEIKDKLEFVKAILESAIDLKKAELKKYTDIQNDIKKT